MKFTPYNLAARRTFLRSLAFTVALVLFASLSPSSVSAQGKGSGRGNGNGNNSCDRACLQALAAARAATARYHRYAAAVQDDFVPVSPCVSSPLGTMGFHYMNFERLLDGELDPAEPEVLLFLPNSQGRMQLVGVEYVLPGTGDEDTPLLFGQPMHFSEERSSWELHAWIWQNNPAGMFADFNPRLSCPE